MAISSYHEYTDCFPPAFTRNQEGERMHSWRVLVGANQGAVMASECFACYNLREPWNGPSNQKILEHDWGDYFACPADRGASRRRCTSYVAVIGDRTFWPGPRPRSSDELDEDWESGILLIEIPDSRIKWMEPADMSVQEALSLFRESSVLPKRPHPEGLHYVNAYGEVRPLSSVESTEQFLDMLQVVTPAAEDKENERE